MYHQWLCGYGKIGTIRYLMVDTPQALMRVLRDQVLPILCLIVLLPLPLPSIQARSSTIFLSVNLAESSS